MQAQGKHANSMLVVWWLGFKPMTSVLPGRRANHLTTVLPSYYCSFWLFLRRNLQFQTLVYWFITYIEKKNPLFREYLSPIFNTIKKNYCFNVPSA